MRWLKRLAGPIVFLLAALCFMGAVMPKLLDRVYYQGPVSDHFDGERFFNPGMPGRDGPSPLESRSFFTGRVRGAYAQWPREVPVRTSIPPARVDGDEMRVTWIGHATVLVQTQGLNILTDPVWSTRTSPVSFAGPKRVRAPGVRFDDLPKIDLVLISHNHYDHLDLATLKRLWKRDRPLIVSPLGNDTILKGRGIESRALDWEQRLTVRPGIDVIALRNHHWSSRWGSDRNRALWSAFAVTLQGGNIFFAGDTGWGTGSWVEEAARHGPWRLALIPIGAYEPRDFMRHHHINPEEAVRLFEALAPVKALGIHWGTVQLTFEPIDEPRQKLEAILRETGIGADRFVAVDAGASFLVGPAD